MDKTKLKNKAIKDLIEDAEDGRVKKATVKEAKKHVGKKQWCLGSKCADTKEALAEKLGISLEDVEYYVKAGKAKQK